MPNVSTKSAARTAGGAAAAGLAGPPPHMRPIAAARTMPMRVITRSPPFLQHFDYQNVPPASERE